MKRRKRNRLIWQCWLLAGVLVALALRIPQEGLLVYSLLWIFGGRLAFERLTRSVPRYRRLRRNGGTHTIAEWNRIKALQNYRCACCQQRLPLTKDHIIPITRGGTDDSWNIQGLCQSCNARKGTKIVDYR